ncbi:MAG: B12-binding domain-containing radical SAM protein [Desulfobacterales bacterium]|nr:B12-binding domain-containing radical SAM protein [Desulfobacterales bacterium]MBF0397635.1 B12-binding domain-containing radical SAM protein [Desulfobacterales bacterium]
MKKIALIISPPFWIKTPHIGLEFIKKFNESKDVKIDIFDLNILFYKLFKLSQRDWLKLDQKFEENLFCNINNKFQKELDFIKEKLIAYDYIGFSIFKRNVNFSINFIHDLQKTFEGHFVLGGPQTREPEFQKNNFKNTSIVIGEGEIPWEKIIYENKRGFFSYEEIQDLDIIPFLDFTGFDMNNYKPIIPLLSSRGCIRRCFFCSECTLYKKFRRHSVDYICRQIEKIIKEYKINHFSFQDSLFNSDIEWIREFCFNIKKFNIKWEAQMIIRNDMDEELLKLIKESGAINIFVGFESGSDSVLKSMRKGFDTNTARLFFNRLNKSQINFEISVIVGYPDETEDDFKETLGFLKENKNIICRIAQISSFTPYNNSAMSNYKLHSEEIINKRLRQIIKFVEKKKIPHKKAFLNNLSYSV